MESILRAIRAGELDASAVVVISNNPEAPALEIARQFGIPAVAIESKGLSRQKHEQLVLEKLAEYPVDYVVLAGYMRILSAEFLTSFRHPAGYYRVINIHPSLLPAFPGKSAYEDAFAHNVRVSGITVHLVDDQVDHGPILAQEAFDRLEADTLETFKARGLAVEHKLFPAVLQRIAREGITLLPQTQQEKVASK
jgi:phosphoribosylglycinamide formyltransferase-1